MNLELKDLLRGVTKRIEIDKYFDVTLDLEIISKEKAHVMGEIINNDGHIIINVDITMPLVVKCDRCLEKADYIYDLAYESEIEKEEIETFSLKKLVEEELYLNTPMQIVCSSDCKGLCISCGANLNEGDCGCVAQPKASPFDVLDSMLK